MTAFKLPLSFDVGGLWKDLELCRSDFRPYRHLYHSVDHRLIEVAMLHAPGGDVRKQWPYPSSSPYAPTPILMKCPRFRRVLEKIPGPKLSARLTCLPAGAVLESHRDRYRNFRYGVVRLHVPIATNERATITIAGRRHHWKAGETWWGDFSKVHGVANRGEEDRVHLVVDVVVTPKLLALFPEDFASRKKKEGIAFHRPPRELGARSLDRFQGRFSVPAEFLSLWHTPGTKLSVRIEKRRGQLALTGRGFDPIGLIPLSESELGLVGAGPGNRLVLGEKGRTSSSLSIVLNGHLWRSPLDGSFRTSDVEYRTELRHSSR